MNIKKVTLVALLLFSFSVMGIAEKNSESKSTYNWEPLIAALMQVESNGNSKAKNGNQIGALQITPILVKECNQILQKRGSSKRFTLQDRLSVEKSKEMFVVFQSYHNPSNDLEYAIRSWNGGPRFSRRATQNYFNKVMRYYKKTDA